MIPLSVALIGRAIQKFRRLAQEPIFLRAGAAILRTRAFNSLEIPELNTDINIGNVLTCADIRTVRLDALGFSE